MHNGYCTTSALIWGHHTPARRILRTVFLTPWCWPQAPSCTSAMMVGTLSFSTHLSRGIAAALRIPFSRKSIMGFFQLPPIEITRTAWVSSMEGLSLISWIKVRCFRLV
ncbi:hypothetical protein PIB30_009170 [Stylosanthes scabra]|uniref:Uncharacterized protein n=1 Tax=Stylosanthes scabra TaxID=79078 RepID=A0ABU6Y3L4_9FABA|nr:hypothetical protein [Stylosanthes scabra]